MKITQIHYEQLYPTGTFANIRLRAEATIDEADNITDCYKRLQQEVNKAFDEMNPNYGNVHGVKQVAGNDYEYSGIAMPEVQQVPPKETRIDGLIATINYCDKLVFLEKFKGTVEKENDPRLTDAFEKKLKALQK